MNWYVVQVMTGKEDAIKDHLQRQNIKSIVPKRALQERSNGIWKRVIRILFPSYVFVYTDMEINAYYAIKDSPDVIKILGDGKGPLPITQEDINHILRLSMDGDPLGVSKVFVEGKKIQVISGPLVGLEGQIVKLDARRFRAKVNISIMGAPRVVELAVDVLKNSES